MEKTHAALCNTDNILIDISFFISFLDDATGLLFCFVFSSRLTDKQDCQMPGMLNHSAGNPQGISVVQHQIYPFCAFS
ncbi:hypothetical protein J7L05_08520 [bacterium]|nr:hypothetical protein [bacterium]